MIVNQLVSGKHGSYGIVKGFEAASLFQVVFVFLSEVGKHFGIGRIVDGGEVGFGVGHGRGSFAWGFERGGAGNSGGELLPAPSA
jgi:hypothetical protein